MGIHRDGRHRLRAAATGIRCDGPDCRKRSAEEVNPEWLSVNVRAFRRQDANPDGPLEHHDVLLDFHDTQCLAAWAKAAPAALDLFPAGP